MMQLSFTGGRDLTKTTLGVLFIGALTVSTVSIMHVFLPALLWATMIVISTWALFLALASRVGGRRGIATAIMSAALLLVLLIPLGLALGALIDNIDMILAKANSLQHLQLPPPPRWLSRIPLQGPRLAAEWQQLFEQGPGSLSAWISPHASRVLLWLAAQIGGIGGLILQFLLVVIISAILYVNGESAAGGVRRFARRLAGASGERAAVLAAATIRAVAMAVIGTAIVQTTIAAIGLVVASVPAAGLLAAAALILNVAQLGPWLVMLPAIAWKFYTGDSLGGFVLLAFAVVAGTIDNFLRPLLIKKGADLPLLLIFAGVIGGMISLGFMGIFVGPVILAVTFVLVREWVDEQPETEKQASA